MRWLLFLSRLALICNAFFLLTFSLQLYDWAKDETLSSTIAILGYFMGVVINPVTVLCYLVLVIMGRKIPVPGWLVALNIVFLFLQLFYIVLLNPGNPNTA